MQWRKFIREFKVEAVFVEGDCQEFCVRGHSDADGGRIWQSRRTPWTVCWRGMIRRGFVTPASACWMLVGALAKGHEEDQLRGISVPA
jgi:hypothetical protein